MENKIEPIDLVYLWVDGSDPVWRKKHQEYSGNIVLDDEVNCTGRFSNNDELKYSLRSIEKYAPWIHKIFIVTDNQTPKWLNTDNPKIKIIDHKDILPQESLPCFNAHLLEKFLHCIPGLSEHFLFSNDDMLLNRSTTPQDFFTVEGLPIIRFKRRTFRQLRWFWREKIRRKPLKNYSSSIMRASSLVKKKYGVYYTGLPHHNIDAYRKSDCQYVAEQVLKEEFRSNWQNHFRADNDIQRVVYSYIALAEKKGKLRYVNEKESLIVRIHKIKDYEKLQKKNPMFFCMNDSEYVKEYQRVILRGMLDYLFPQKSLFEKDILE